MSDPTTVAIWNAASVRDETGALVGSVGYWGDAAGQPITDPDQLRALEERMSKDQTGTYAEGDRVVILGDDGNDTKQAGVVSVDVGGNTYHIILDDGRTIGAQPSHLRKED